MIQESFIREWSEMAPWSKNEMVEQDLIICRALVSIFSDDFQIIYFRAPEERSAILKAH